MTDPANAADNKPEQMSDSEDRKASYQAELAWSKKLHPASASAAHRMYILYDARACANAGTDKAAVICTARSMREAARAAKMLGYGCACYSYAMQENPDMLTDEQWERDFND